MSWDAKYTVSDSKYYYMHVQSLIFVSSNGALDGGPHVACT